MECSATNRINLFILFIISVVILISCQKEDVVNDLFDDQFEQFTDDRDGHVYNLIQIGEQTWMAENLAYLPQVNAPDDHSEISERYYVYGYNGNNTNDAVSTKNYKSYGVLYNWSAAINACPSGWHLPEVTEWENLVSYLVDNGGGKIEPDSLAFTLMTPFGWRDYFSNDSIDVDKTGRNSTLFSAVPGGYLYYDGVFYSDGNSGFWWTATHLSPNNAGAYILTYNSPSFYQYDFNIEIGFSVRCVKY